MTIHGIHTIDTGFGRPMFDAAYLVVERGRGAFIDSGTNYSVPRFLEALKRVGLTPGDVDWVILTHVHLDHAGGAGELMTHLPSAKLLVHPRGARHMIDPSMLIAGATAVYGAEEIERSYGTIVPVPEERVVEATDGYTVDLAGRALLCIDTPGHARHHNAIHDEGSNAFFTGDVFGLSYREFDVDGRPFVIPTTSPVQFEPEALHDSIERMLGYSPEAMYLTHYDRVGEVRRLADDLHGQIDAMCEIAREFATAPDRHRRMVQALGALYIERAAAHGCRQTADEVEALLHIDIELNAQGLAIWLDRAKRG